LQELFNGGPSREAMTAAEFDEWMALITVVEKHEQEEANKG
jgi:hypothetical protein